LEREFESMGLHIPPALRHRSFRLYWIGLTISLAGSQMQLWALFWHIRTLTDQPIALGGIGLARIVPIILFSLVGGAVADVLDRRKLLYLTQSTMTLVAAALAWLTLTGHIDLWHIYLLTAIQALAIAFDTPARQAMVPNMVPSGDLPNAFSLTAVGGQIGAIVGPALAGMVIAYWGQYLTYLLNAVSYLAVILALIMMGPIAQQKTANRRAGLSLPAVAEGLKFIWGHPIILSTMILDFFATFFSSANTLMPIVARDILHVGAVAYGWLSSAQAIGAVAAAVVVSQVRELRRQGIILLAAVLVFGVATIVFGAARGFILAMFALAFMGAADSVSTIVRNTVRQLQTPDNIRGRMTSVNQLFFMGGPQLGEIEAGLVAQLLGAPFAIVSGGVGCLLAVVWVVRRWPQLRLYNGDEPVLAGSPAD
jgi:MFS family permease